MDLKNNCLTPSWVSYETVSQLACQTSVHPRMPGYLQDSYFLSMAFLQSFAQKVTITWRKDGMHCVWSAFISHKHSGKTIGNREEENESVKWSKARSKASRGHLNKNKHAGAETDKRNKVEKENAGVGKIFKCLSKHKWAYRQVIGKQLAPLLPVSFPNEPAAVFSKTTPRNDVWATLHT